MMQVDTDKTDRSTYVSNVSTYTPRLGENKKTKGCIPDMNTYKIIRECSRQGIRLMADGDSLKVDAPKEGCYP
jgi:predicted peroxiredoxin